MFYSCRHPHSSHSSNAKLKAEQVKAGSQQYGLQLRHSLSGWQLMRQGQSRLQASLLSKRGAQEVVPHACLLWLNRASR